VITDQNNHSTAYTFDVYQRLKKVEDPYGTITEYSYDTLSNLIQVIAAKNATEQNTTTMTYDSLSKKRSMTDPDMGYWTYDYDKSGNLISQTDAKSQ
jgi:YD repeat-containing protein